MKQSLIVILGIILIANAIEVGMSGGVKDLGESRMIELMECSDPKPMCKDYRPDHRWLFGGLGDKCHSSIHKTPFYPINVFAKYYFLDGYMIPRKYNHLIEDKLKCDNK